MTVQQDIQRAGLRVMMAVSMHGVPDYSADPDVLSRVGNVIGATTSHEERRVRASDSVDRSTSRVTTLQPVRTGPNTIWLWPIAMGTSGCTVGLLVVLAYWQFG